MPFRSKQQWKKCYAMKRKGQAGSWDCSEFAHETKTKFKNLPQKKQAEAMAKLAVCRYLVKEAAQQPTLQPRLHSVIVKLGQGLELPDAIEAVFPTMLPTKQAQLAHEIIRGAIKLAEANFSPSGNLLPAGPKPKVQTRGTYHGSSAQVGFSKLAQALGWASTKVAYDFPPLAPYQPLQGFGAGMNPFMPQQLAPQGGGLEDMFRQFIQSEHAAAQQPPVDMNQQLQQWSQSERDTMQHPPQPQMAQQGAPGPQEPDYSQFTPQGVLGRGMEHLRGLPQQLGQMLGGAGQAPESQTELHLGHLPSSIRPIPNAHPGEGQIGPIPNANANHQLTNEDFALLGQMQQPTQPGLPKGSPVGQMQPPGPYMMKLPAGQTMPPAGQPQGNSAASGQAQGEGPINDPHHAGNPGSPHGYFDASMSGGQAQPSQFAGQGPMAPPPRPPQPAPGPAAVAQTPPQPPAPPVGNQSISASDLGRESAQPPPPWMINPSTGQAYKTPEGISMARTNASRIQQQGGTPTQQNVNSSGYGAAQLAGKVPTPQPQMQKPPFATVSAPKPAPPPAPKPAIGSVPLVGSGGAMRGNFSGNSPIGGRRGGKLFG